MQPVTETSDPEKYQVEGLVDLVIMDATLEDAGTYECRLVLSRVQASANLVVLGKTLGKQV